MYTRYQQVISNAPMLSEFIGHSIISNKIEHNKEYFDLDKALQLIKHKPEKSLSSKIMSKFGKTKGSSSTSSSEKSDIKLKQYLKTYQQPLVILPEMQHPKDPKHDDISLPYVPNTSLPIDISAPPHHTADDDIEKGTSKKSKSDSQ
jgi:hypothetical protein